MMDCTARKRMPGAVCGHKQRGIRAVALVAAGIWTLLCLLSMFARIENEKRIALGEMKDSMQGQLAIVADRLESGLHEMANLVKVIALEPWVASPLEALEPTREKRLALDAAARNSFHSA